MSAHFFILLKNWIKLKNLNANFEVIDLYISCCRSIQNFLFGELRHGQLFPQTGHAFTVDKFNTSEMSAAGK